MTFVIKTATTDRRNYSDYTIVAFDYPLQWSNRFKKKHILDWPVSYLANLVEGCVNTNDNTAHQENDCKRDTNAVVLIFDDLDGDTDGN